MKQVRSRGSVENLKQPLQIRGGAGEHGAIRRRCFGEGSENPLAGQAGPVGQELEKVVIPAAGPGDDALAALDDLRAQRD